jgi:hypothetical protein
MSELIEFIKDMMELAREDMNQSESFGAKEDVAYAEGAYNAYEVMLKKLESHNE